MSDDANWSQMSKASVARHLNFANSIEATQSASQFIEETAKATQADVTLEKLLDETLDNSAMGIQIRTKKLEKKKELKTEKAKQAQESVLVRKEDADSLADGFSQRQGNREYHLDRRLLSELVESLGVGINEESSLDELIGYIRHRLMIDGRPPDPAIIDKAFEFLVEVLRLQMTKASDERVKERLFKILKNMESAKLKHFSAHADKIQVAEKIIGAVDAVIETTKQGLEETLDRYRDIVHNPPDLQELRKHYQVIGYRLMMLEMKGLNSYLGGNLKRADLEGPELAQLRKTVLKMQSLIWIFRQTKAHIPTMESYLNLNHVLS